MCAGRSGILLRPTRNPSPPRLPRLRLALRDCDFRPSPAPACRLECISAGEPGGTVPGAGGLAEQGALAIRPGQDVRNGKAWDRFVRRAPGDGRRVQSRPGRRRPLVAEVRKLAEERDAHERKSYMRFTHDGKKLADKHRPPVLSKSEVGNFWDGQPLNTLYLRKRKFAAKRALDLKQYGLTEGDRKVLGALEQSRVEAARSRTDRAPAAASAPGDDPREPSVLEARREANRLRRRGHSLGSLEFW